mmetsp:Transcript_34141/g.63165  ORF Transcript_34141/g.63165 Transcript_34141/m.63165 type:complete len:83 (+) Transcript_34141:494-742(+)
MVFVRVHVHDKISSEDNMRNTHQTISHQQTHNARNHDLKLRFEGINVRKCEAMLQRFQDNENHASLGWNMFQDKWMETHNAE